MVEASPDDLYNASINFTAYSYFTETITANSVEFLLEVNEVVVKVALVFYVFCNYESAVEDLLNCTLSCSEACITLLG